MLGTRGAASARGFGFGAQVSPFWYGAAGASTFEGINSSVTDGDGNIYVAGSYNYDFTYGFYRCYIQKYTKNGILLWGKHYNVENNTALVNPAIALDNPASPSFVYMLAGNGSTNFGVIMKIDVSNGSVSWSRRYSGSNSWNWNGIAVSGSNIYAVGNHFSVLYVVRYDTNGTFAGNQSYTINNRNQAVNAMGCAAASNGDLYVFGSCTNQETAFWMRLTSSLSTPTWQFTNGGLGSTRDTRYGLTSDSSGNLYWGSIYATGDGPKFRAGMLNSSGTQIWNRAFNPNYVNQSVQSNFASISVDSSGSVYLGGHSNFGVSGSRPFAAKFSSTGTSLFNRQVLVIRVSSGQTTSSYNGLLIAPASDGLVYTLGNSSSNAGPTFFGVLKLPQDGSRTGNYTYASRDLRYEYASLSASFGIDTLGTSSSNPSISTFSISMSSSSFTARTGDEQKVLGPLPI